MNRIHFLKGWMNVQIGGCQDGWMDGYLNGWMMDGWMVG